jgi:hypothetical protein
MEGRDSLAELILESGLDPADYSDVVDGLESLRGLVPEQAPVPSRELAALLARGVVTPMPAMPRQRAGRPRTAVVAAAVAATVALGTGVAAASNTLPEPAQRLLSNISDKYLPFHIPSPDERDDTWRYDPNPLSQPRPGQGSSVREERTKAGHSDKPGKQATKAAEQSGEDTEGTDDVLPVDSEGSLPTEEEAATQDPEGSKPDKSKDGTKPSEPGLDSGSVNGGTDKGRGVVEPPKGKPTAPPGGGGNADEPPVGPPDDPKASPTTGQGTGVSQSGKGSQSSRP